jgi:serine/threonine-protein kinase
MGEVYRAQDARLGRAVAIKVLPEALAVDGERIARLEREARVLASLNHPHIAALYGFEEANSRQFLVMELVEGDTLADRLARGAIPVDESLRIARQIVEALEAAHEKGVVHRDLKPANIKITPEDRVKVLDFGLARLQEPDDPDKPSSLTHSPTLSVMATQAGIILGTAGYMSPEQAKGAAVDHRSDLFSFGVVLYEILTGRRAFQADTAAETMAAVLMRDPDLAALPSGLNPRLTELLRRCFEKNPRQRWHASGDVRAELEAIIAAPRATTRSSSSAPRWKRAIPFAATALAAGVLAAAAAWWMKPSTPSDRVVAFSVPYSDDEAPFRRVALSRDGSRIVYRSDGQLWIRDIADTKPRPIPGTEGVNVEPTMSPNGRSIAFVDVTTRALRTIDLAGSGATTVATVDVPFSFNWHESGILYTQTGGIFRVVPGSVPEQLVTLGSGERAHAPQLLPDGKTIVFTLIKGLATNAVDQAEIVAQSLDPASRRRLIAGTDSRYADGYLMFMRGAVLFAARLDPGTLSVGTPMAVIPGVRRNANGSAQYDVSPGGSLAYIPGPTRASASMVGLPLEMVIVNESGATDRVTIQAGPYASPRLSPDGTRVVYSVDTGTDAQLWLHDLGAGTSPRRLTFQGNNRFPVWSANGQSIAFQSDRETDLAIFLQAADVSGAAAERLTRPAPGVAHVPESFSPQGNLLFSAADTSKATLWSYSTTTKAVTQFGNVQSTAPFNAEFSPDGAWVAYGIRGGGAVTTIHVADFPFSGRREYAVSRPEEGAHHAIWGPLGRTLFYVPLSADVILRDVIQHSGTLAFREPRTWPGKLPNVNPYGGPRNFDRFPDGKRFIYLRPESALTGAPAQIDVVLNWVELFQQRLAQQ